MGAGIALSMRLISTTFEGSDKAHLGRARLRITGSATAKPAESVVVRAGHAGSVRDEKSVAISEATIQASGWRESNPHTHPRTSPATFQAVFPRNQHTRSRTSSTKNAKLRAAHAGSVRDRSASSSGSRV